LLSFLELDSGTAPPVSIHPFVYGSTKEFRDDEASSGSVLAIAMPTCPRGRFLDYSPKPPAWGLTASTGKSKKMGISRNPNRNRARPNRGSTSPFHHVF